MNTTSISEFYRGKNLVVFGSTTFPGKVLLEKLLRSCPTIEKIFCPIACNNHSPADTFAEIYASKLFDRVRREHPKFHDKLVPFDINLLFISTTSNDEQTSSMNLQTNIDICFYMANTSVEFEEQNLKEMIKSNVLHLKNVLNFLKTCTKLQSIVYLSSIYANIGKKILPCFALELLLSCHFRLSLYR